MSNLDVRETAKRANVSLWRIADRLGIADYAFSKKLRKELSADEKRKIFGIIDELAGEVV